MKQGFYFFFLNFSTRTLLKLGMFTLKDEREWWFSLPVCGKFTMQILEGRKEILKILKRKKFKEMLLKNLMKFKLKSSTLPISFHIRDLSATSSIKITQTTSGSLISILN
jgi:serine/threonine kinase 19